MSLRPQLSEKMLIPLMSVEASETIDWRARMEKQVSLLACFIPLGMECDSNTPHGIELQNFTDPDMQAAELSIRFAWQMLNAHWGTFARDFGLDMSDWDAWGPWGFRQNSKIIYRRDNSIFGGRTEYRQDPNEATLLLGSSWPNERHFIAKHELAHAIFADNNYERLLPQSKNAMGEANAFLATAALFREQGNQLPYEQRLMWEEESRTRHGYPFAVSADWRYWLSRLRDFRGQSPDDFVHGIISYSAAWLVANETLRDASCHDRIFEAIMQHSFYSLTGDQHFANGPIENAINRLRNRGEYPQTEPAPLPAGASAPEKLVQLLAIDHTDGGMQMWHEELVHAAFAPTVYCDGDRIDTFTGPMEILNISTGRTPDGRLIQINPNRIQLVEMTGTQHRGFVFRRGAFYGDGVNSLNQIPNGTRLTIRMNLRSPDGRLVRKIHNITFNADYDSPLGARTTEKHGKIMRPDGGQFPQVKE